MFYVGQALNEIATLFFAIPPPRTAAANPFGDIMSSLLGGGLGGLGGGMGGMGQMLQSMMGGAGRGR